MIRSEGTYLYGTREYFTSKAEADARAAELSPDQSPIVYQSQNHVWMEEGAIYWTVAYYIQRPEGSTAP